MPSNVLISLIADTEDPERITLAFLSAEAALRAGHRVAVWLAQEAVRLALPGRADVLETPALPPMRRLLSQYLAAGGELFVCRTSLRARGLNSVALLASAKVVGNTAVWDWLREPAVVVNY